MAVMKEAGYVFFTFLTVVFLVFDSKMEEYNS